MGEEGDMQKYIAKTQLASIVLGETINTIDTIIAFII